MNKYKLFNIKTNEIEMLSETELISKLSLDYKPQKLEHLLLPNYLLLEYPRDRAEAMQLFFRKLNISSDKKLVDIMSYIPTFEIKNFNMIR